VVVANVINGVPGLHYIVVGDGLHEGGPLRDIGITHKLYVIGYLRESIGRSNVDIALTYIS
jgi:hypothetical protein